MTSRVAARTAALPVAVLLLAHTVGEWAATAEQKAAQPSQVQRASRVRKLKLPDVPYHYDRINLPGHFTHAAA
jgi:hypothetical protein